MPLIIAGILAPIIGTVLGTAITGATTIGLALAVITITFFLRVLFMLVRAYVMIIILIVTGPLIIATGAIAPWGIRAWFMNLLANILVFPVTGLIFGIGGVITTQLQNNNDVWKAPLLGQDNTFLAGMFSIGLLLILPEIDGVIKQALGVRGINMQMGMSPNLQRSTGDFVSRVPGGIGTRVLDWRTRFGL